MKGVSDPNEAKNIVVKGTYSYKFVKNITKAGNIDSLVFDFQESIIELKDGMKGLFLSSVLTFSLEFWKTGNLSESFSKSL
jgi:hypothetical protein